jgi:hypothetical protein
MSLNQDISMKNIIFFFFLLINYDALSQLPAFNWAVSIGGNEAKSSYDIALDADNNVYIVGRFKGTVDFDPDTTNFNLTAIGGYDIFIAKLSNQGKLLWAKQIGGNSLDYAIAIGIDSTNHIYFTGAFSEVVDFDPNIGIYNLSTLVGYNNTFICKLDTNGSFVWAKKIGNGYNDPFDLKLDNTGNCYITGKFASTVDFDPNTAVFNLSSASWQDNGYVLKLDNDGNFIWANAFKGSEYNHGYGVAVDLQGNVFVVGHFSGTVDFDSGINTFNLTTIATNDRDIYLAKINAAGNLVWAKSYSAPEFNSASKIEVDTFGNTYIVGSFYGTIDFDTGLGVYNVSADSGFMNSYLLKLDTFGNLVWANGITGMGDVILNNVHLDNNNHVYVTGSIRNSADFDPSAASYNITTNGNIDIVFAKYDISGNFKWAKNIGGYPFGGIGGGNALSICTDENENIYQTGNFGLTVDFDIGADTNNLTSLSNTFQDIFVLKISPCTVNFVSQFISLCSNDSVIVGNNTYYTAGVYIDTLTNSNGCDSILTTSIDVWPSFSSNQNYFICNGDTVTVGNNLYYNAGVYIDTLTNSNGCDSILTSTIIISPSFNSNQNYFICEGDSVVLGNTMYYSAGNYIDTLSSSNGCDSILTTTITVYPSFNSNQNYFICKGDSVVLGNTMYYSAGVYIDSLTNSNGCDSILTSTIIVFPILDSIQNLFLCAGDRVLIDGSYENTTGTFIQNVIDTNGCNQKYITNLNVFQPINTGVKTINNGLQAQSQTLQSASFQWLDCNNNSSPIINENKQTFKPNSTGSYAVIISINNCIDTSDCYDYTASDSIFCIDEYEMLISPNPITNEFTLSINICNATVKKISVYSIDGKIVFSSNNFSQKIDVFNLASGIYLLMCETNTKTYHQKFLKL